MDKKKEFNEALAALIQFAQANNNIITMNDIKLYFNEILDDESKYSFIYEYLKNNKIIIKGPADDTGESEHDLFVSMYMDDLKSVSAITDDEINILVSEVLKGNADAKEKLICAHLDLVVQIADNYTDCGLPKGDLISEGNLGLITGIDSFKSGDFKKHIIDEINSYILSAINSQSDYNKIEEHLVSKANILDETSRRLVEDLGREPSVEELAMQLNITTDEVKSIIKISLDALNVTPNDTMPLDSCEDKEPRRARRGPKIKC